MSVGHSGLVQRVRSALQAEPSTRDAAIDVVDENGTVTLTGTVASDDVRRVAEEIAQQQEGVIQIINELLVEEDGWEGDESAVVPHALGANRFLLGT